MRAEKLARREMAKQRKKGAATESATALTAAKQRPASA